VLISTQCWLVSRAAAVDSNCWGRVRGTQFNDWGLKHLQKCGRHDAASDGYGLRGEQGPDGGEGGGGPALLDAAGTGRKSDLLRQLEIYTYSTRTHTLHTSSITCKASTLTHEMHLFDWKNSPMARDCA